MKTISLFATLFLISISGFSQTPPWVRYAPVYKTSPQTTTYTDITNGMVLGLPFSNSVSDSSLYGNNGTAHGSPGYTTGPGSVANTAIALTSSSQYVTGPASHSLDITNGAITISGWVYNTTSSGNYRQLINKRISSTPAAAYGLCLFNANNSLDFYYTYTNKFFIFIQSTPTMNLNTWYFVAATYTWGNSSLAALYINGSAVAGSWAISGTGDPGAIPYSDATATVPLQIGQNDNGSESIQCNLTGWRIYNRSLAAGEIGTLYTNGVYGGMY